MSKRREKGRSKPGEKSSSTVEIRASIRQALQDLVDADTQVQSLLQSRRTGEDRRAWAAMPCVPFLDGNGVTVTQDRRRFADRRVGNIQVHWANDQDT